MDEIDGKTPRRFVSIGLFMLILLFAGDVFGWWNDEWEYRHKISFDTSPAGADVSESLSDVPVLVRLHTGNFNFMEAKENGEDIRFVSSDDATQLTHHIERFDTIDEMAAVWVKVPKLSANSNQDYIWMYYGNDEAVAGGDAKAIFDGMQAADFHFEELEGQPQDQTANANHAMSFLGGRGLSGVIGNCVLFSGAADKMVIKPSASTSFTNGFTFSAWVRISQEQDNAYLYSQQSGENRIRVTIDRSFLFAEIANGEAIVAATERTSELSSGVWHHVVVTAAPNDRMAVYIDGVETSAVPLSGTIPGMETEISIGGDLDGNHGYYGEMDELGLAGVARSSGWVKASFASQGQEGRLMIFGEEETGDGDGEMPEMNMDTIVSNITLDAWVVMGVLAVMAIGCWFIFLTKAVLFFLIEKENRVFLTAFEEQSSLTALSEADGQFPNSMIYKIYQEACRKLTACLDSAKGCGMKDGGMENPVKTGSTGKLSHRAINVVKATLEKGILEQTRQLNSWIVVLTLSISGGPFLGLLGTVWGVMNTFAALGLSGEASLAAIAPGVASALTATITGLLVAIPALFSYNYLVGRIRNISMDLGIFVDQFLIQIEEIHGEA